MSKRKTLFLIFWMLSVLAVLMAILLIGVSGSKKTEGITEVMRDAVLHEENKVYFFGLNVNPAVFSAYTVTAILLFSALLIRIFIIPKFKAVPGKLQNILEVLVSFFADMAKEKSPHRFKFLGAYVFGAGIYVFFSTVFELFGVQTTTIYGDIITLPAPISDINAAIAMGVTSFAVILGAGIICNGLKGGLKVLKDFSLPISMSFRLFGSLLSGLLVTELVYYYTPLSIGLPVVVAIIFTLPHALIQAYVLVTLVSNFFGEATHPNSFLK